MERRITASDYPGITSANAEQRGIHGNGNTIIMTIERIMGSVDHGLTRTGREEAMRIGITLALKGGLTAMFTSPQKRAVETARIVASYQKGSWRRGDMEGGDMEVRITEGLAPWYLGQFEGQPEEEAEPFAKWLMLHPDYTPAGKNPESTQAPESFESFKNRLLEFVRSMSGRMSEKRRIGLVTHSRDVQIIRAWDKAGRKGTDLDMEMCCDESGSGLVPVWLMTKSSLKPLDLKTDQDEGAGLYIVRHGPTDWDAQDNKAPAMASLERRLKSVRVR